MQAVRFRVAGAVAGCVLLAGVLGGCTSARSSLGTSASSCYLALPVSAKAVGGHGRLLGVRVFTLTELRKEAPHLARYLSITRPSGQPVCVVAFTGTFSHTSVTKPFGRLSGHLAVVVSRAPANTLLGTVIFTRLPLKFSHFFG